MTYTAAFWVSDITAIEAMTAAIFVSEVAVAPPNAVFLSADYSVGDGTPSGELVWNEAQQAWRRIDKYVFDAAVGDWVRVDPVTMLQVEGPMTQAEYNALGTHDPEVLYIIEPE